MSMLNIQIVRGDKEDFFKFTSKLHAYDRVTLQRYFKIATKRKEILLVRRLGPGQAQILVIPKESLPKLQEKLSFKSSYHGWAGVNVPQSTYFLFDDLISNPVEEEPKKIIRRKRGRPNVSRQAEV